MAIYNTNNTVGTCAKKNNMFERNGVMYRIPRNAFEVGESIVVFF